MHPVLIRPGKLGDVVLLGATTKALGHCVVATDARYHGIARRLQGVERVITLDAVRQERGRLIDLQGSLATRWLCRRREHRTLDKRSVRRRLWLRTGFPRRPRPSVAEIYAEAAGVRPARLPWIVREPGPADTLGLAPGAAFRPKQYDPAQFVSLGRTWEGPVTIFGGPGDERAVETVWRGLPDACVVLETGFEATLAALPALAVMVAGDTGLLHVAGAAGVPVVGLFGPTHPADGFFVYRGEVVQRSLPCRPCALHRVERCRVGHHECMAHGVETVRDAVTRSARKGRPASSPGL